MDENPERENSSKLSDSIFLQFELQGQADYLGYVLSGLYKKTMYSSFIIEWRRMVRKIGTFGGLLFAGLLCGFVKILSARKDKLKERYGIKGKVLYEGAANYLTDTETIGGWIFLMEDRLCFVSHSFNFMTGQCIISYSDIVEVTEGKMIRSMAIHLCNNKVEEFIVNNHKEWMDKISYYSRGIENSSSVLSVGGEDTQND